MNEIKCPNCGEVFTVNESQYAELISQVRTVEFDKELHERIKQELTLVEQKALNEQQAKLAQKDQEIAQLQSQIQNFDTEKELAKKEVEQSASQSLLEKEKAISLLKNGMKKPMMMPSKSIKIIKLEPQRGWKRFCFRTFSTVSGRSFS